MSYKLQNKTNKTMLFEQLRHLLLIIQV